MPHAALKMLLWTVLVEARMFYSYDRSRTAAGPDTAAQLTNFMNHAQEPEKALIALADKLGKEGQHEVEMYLDEAITFFSKARGALAHARMRLK